MNREQPGVKKRAREERVCLSNVSIKQLFVAMLLYIYDSSSLFFIPKKTKQADSTG